MDRFASTFAGPYTRAARSRGRPTPLLAGLVERRRRCEPAHRPAPAARHQRPREPRPRPERRGGRRPDRRPGVDPARLRRRERRAGLHAARRPGAARPGVAVDEPGRGRSAVDGPSTSRSRSPAARRGRPPSGSTPSIPRAAAVPASSSTTWCRCWPTSSPARAGSCARPCGWPAGPSSTTRPWWSTRCSTTSDPALISAARALAAECDGCRRQGGGPMASIEDRIADLERELAALKAEVGAAPEQATSRREVFKALAVGAAGVAAGMVAGAAPAAAADGGNLVIGAGGDANNTGQTRTILFYTGAALGAPGVNTNFLQVRDDSLNRLPARQRRVHQLREHQSRQRRVRLLAVQRQRCLRDERERQRAVRVGAGGIGALMQGGRANAQLTPFGTAAPARGDAHTVGELINDVAGDLWYCTVSGTPGTWRKVGGPARPGSCTPCLRPSASTTPAPARVLPPRETVRWPAGRSRVVGLASGFVGPTLTPAAPPGATAALFSLTLDATAASGFLGRVLQRRALARQLQRELVHRRPDPRRHDGQRGRPPVPRPGPGGRPGVDALHRRRDRLLPLKPTC